MRNPMQPRIVVPDGDDMATVVAALVQYTHGVSARAMLNGDFSHMIDELQISVGLLETLRDQARSEHATEVFGPMPSDEQLAESIEKFREEFGPE